LHKMRSGAATCSFADMHVTSIGKNTQFAPKSRRQEIFIVAKQLADQDLGDSLGRKQDPPPAKCTAIARDEKRRELRTIDGGPRNSLADSGFKPEGGVSALNEH
jgi:hypothetical protein